MNLRILKFALLLAFVERVGSFPLGCPHNGTFYEEGEIVKSEDPCLSCVCQKGALECSLRVCTEHANVLPPGCFLLHKPDHCCPQLFCDESFNPSGIELRTGYKLKNKIHGNDCIINGSIYAEGSAVASSQPCEYCYCVQGEMKCLKPRCLQFFEGCKPAFEKTSCCPTHYDCRDANVNFLTAQMKYFVSNDSLRSLSSSTLEFEKAYLNLSESAETNLMKNGGEQREELTTTANEERYVEESTMEPEQEATIPVAEDYVTTIGLQIMKSENCSEESVTSFVTEESTFAIEMDGNFSFAKEFSNGSRDNASQEVDDYDSYDYSEPQLPPSLPNLVIFPFVAADAVVKGESARAPGTYDKDEVERIDAHHIFYQDYFSPPSKTEGGFIPKQPPKSREPFYKDVYLRGKEQMDPPDEGLKKNAEPSLQTTTELNFPTSVDNQRIKTAPAGNSEGDMNIGLLQDRVLLDTEAAHDFLIRNETPFIASHQSKKPITVTYKNFIVDFYPNYLITTMRETQSEQPQIATEETFYWPTGKLQNAVAPSEEAIEAPLSVFDREKIRETKATSSSPVSSFFNEFIKPFSASEITPMTTTITLSSKKQKFSSKIKSQLTSTVKPKLEKVDQKREPEVVTENLSISGFSVSLSVTEKPKIYSEKRKPVKKEEITGKVETVKPAEIKIETLGFFQPSKGGNLPIENRKPEVNENEDGDKYTTPKAGTLLKVAGCNIYGMMYRVGKIITELSGPCLECLCTDLGVQCKPLKC